MTDIGQGRRKWVWPTLALAGLLALGLQAGSAATVSAPLPATLAQQLGSSAAQARAQLPDGAWLTLDRSGTRLQLAADPEQRHVLRSWELPVPHRLASVSLMPSGRVLIWGGLDAQRRLQAAGLLFDPLTQTLSPTERIVLTPRAGHTATVLTDGRLLMTGGWSVGGIAKSELWDERTNAVVVVQNSQVPRLGHQGQLQANGSVRLSSGLDTRGRAFLKALDYDPATQAVVVAAPAVSTSTKEVPALTASLPASHATNVSPHARLAVRFNVPTRVAGLNASSVTLFGPGGRTPIRVMPVEQGRLVFVTPQQALLPQSRYTLLVDGAYSASGKPIPLGVVDFRTAALASDGTPALADSSATSSGALHLMTGNDPGVAACAPSTHLQPCRQTHTLEDGVWTPGRDNTDSRWRVYGATLWPTPNPGMAQVAARYQVTALRGRVLQVDEKPVADVEVSIGARVARTNDDGWFVLTGIPAGRQELYVDGSTASNGKVEYGQFVVGVQVAPDKLTELPYLMYLPRITARDKIRIPAPLAQETVLTHPDLPGLEIHLPAGTVIRDHKGRLVTELAIVPTPVNRAPFPVAANYPMYFTLEPGGAVIQGLTPQAAKGIRIVYPNYDRHAPGTVSNFWIYDPAIGWRVYGQGKVNPDGTQFVPEPGVGLFQTMGGSYNVPNNDPPPEKDQPPNHDPCGCSGAGGGATTGDPIDLRTGSFTYGKTDISIPDLMSIGLGRNYRPHDNIKRAFGTGTAMNYSYALYSADYSEMQLALPSGSYLGFGRVSGSGAYGTWQQMGSTTAFTAATIETGSDASWGYGYWLTMRNGTRMFFGAAYHNYGASPLLGIQDRNGNRIDLIYVGGLLTKITSPSGRYVELTYDTANRIATARDHTARTWTYGYGDFDLLSQVTFPDGTHEDITYEKRVQTLAGQGDTLIDHRVKTMVNRRGQREVLNTYDRIEVPGIPGSYSLGRVLKQTQADSSDYTIDYAHQDTTGFGVLVTEPDGRQRRLTYGAGRYYPLSDTIGYGTVLAQTVRFERDSAERITARIDALGRRTEYQYDSWGQLTRVTYQAGTPDAKSVLATYTANGDLASVTDPIGRITTLGYTDRCLTQITDPLNRSTQIVCNGAGQPLSVTDPLGNTTQYYYDGFELTAVVDPLGRATGLAYDALGRLIVIRDPQGHITRREYDVDGRVSKVTDPSGNATQLSYDGNGNLTAVLLPHGNGVTYDYDARDHLLTRTDSLSQAERWTYDAMGRVKTYTDRKQQATQVDLDVLGRPRVVTYADTSTQTASYDAGNRLQQLDDSSAGTASWQYDVFDRVLNAATPEGTLAYEYDTIGRRIGMTAASQAKVQYQYDAGDQLTRILQGSEVVEFQYDAAGRRTQMTLPNGVATGYAYDAASQLTGMAYAKPDQTVIGDLGYAYNTVGQRIAQIGSLASDGLPNASSNNTFDDNNRQTQSKGQALSYDANGNLTGDGTRIYVWNARNQLTTIKQGTQTIASFGYDALGRRTARTEGGQAIAYLYDGANAVQETQGATVNSILTGLGVDERFARNDTGGRTYFLTDALGSTRLLTNASKTVVQRYDYTPYGETTQTQTGLSNPYQYTGRERDQSGLYYYRARYYSAGMGRFIAEDPIGFAGGWNSYAYVGGNPVSLIDPLGLADYYTFNGNTLSGYVTLPPPFDSSLAGAGTRRMLEFSVPARSGPWGDGPLPEGSYGGRNLRKRSDKAMSCPNGNGWSLDLDDKGGRSLLRIHPDGNVPGTLGCVGVVCGYQNQVFNSLTNGLSGGHDITLDVNYGHGP